MPEAKTGRELTFEERVSKIIISILALESPMSLKRQLITDVLDLPYKHEEDIITEMRRPDNIARDMMHLTCVKQK